MFKKKFFCFYISWRNHWKNKHTEDLDVSILVFFCILSPIPSPILSRRRNRVPKRHRTKNVQTVNHGRKGYRGRLILWLIRCNESFQDKGWYNIHSLYCQITPSLFSFTTRFCYVWGMVRRCKLYEESEEDYLGLRGWQKVTWN